MIRVKSVFGKFFSLKISDRQLFSTAIKAFTLSHATCPQCGAVGESTAHSTYRRYLISIEGGKRIDSIVSIPRIQCISCGKTHAILPDVLIPYGSYSLRFILVVLNQYLKRTVSVQAFCASWEIASSTLYTWIHLFEQQASLWLGMLKTVKHMDALSLQEISHQDSFPSAFHQRFKFSFLQSYHFSQTTHSHRVLDSS